MSSKCTKIDNTNEGMNLINQERINIKHMKMKIDSIRDSKR